ncbi:uncharacterized protein [Acropora muricata]|uniref:uncharacterized protein n=1 Tax=Acropora muricata TaxID=159855 RepID=UPI0034E50F6B
MESQFVAQENAPRNQDRYPLAAETVLKEARKGFFGCYSHYGELPTCKPGNGSLTTGGYGKDSCRGARYSEIVIDSGQDPITKTLGISWNSTKDEFTVTASPVSPGFQTAKRNILRKIATIFDPLGFVCPSVVVAKILLQELWMRGYGWDDEVQDEIANKIEGWFEHLKGLAEVKIPRCLRSSEPVKSKRIVTFVDASQEAYGAAVYMRCEYHNATITSHLIAAQSLVAPLTPMTEPRLELMGANLGLRLTQSLLTVLEAPMQSVTFYSGSTDVLWWVRGRGKDFRPFVANRIGEIQMFTEPSQWQHVFTEENPADLCTRGATPSELADSPLWWNGPDWLTKDFKEWSKMQDPNRPREMPEKKTSQRKEDTNGCTTLLTNNLQKEAASKQDDKLGVWRLDPKRFSSWIRLLRVHARVRRVLLNMRRRDNRIARMELLPEDIKDAEEEIVRLAQREAFCEEYTALRSGKPISKKSQLIKLNPCIDEDGNIRFPIILPRGHWVTKLIVKNYHERGNHVAGVNFTLCQLSEKFWIIAAREEIRELDRECNECKRRRSKPACQIMAPLPKARPRFTFKPLAQTAVDFAVPLYTVQGRRKPRQKRWLCLFTCLETRAVHLEMAWGLDTDTFLNVFTRFTSRRGVPKEVISDGGTNFVGAVGELKKLVSQLDRQQLLNKTAELGVTWRFNPPGAPHFGRAHEVPVKASKKAIYAVVGDRDVTDEELITVSTGVESLLNSRPLTYQSSDPRDDVPLTPNHFLHGQMGGQFAPESVDTITFYPRQR